MPQAGANQMNATWKERVVAGGTWEWRDGRLWHRQAAAEYIPASGGWRARFVHGIYADQNRSPAVRRTLQQLVAQLGPGGVGLNIGAGDTRFPGVVNLEISPRPNVDIVGYGSELPFQDGAVDLVIMQEVLEHVADFQELLTEVWRVLKPGGRFYCQVPFQIGFHPGPCDYWRFTRQGLEHLFAPPTWQLEQLAISLGHGSGFYRIAVEFVAVTTSCIAPRLYHPAKAGAAIALYPFKWFDCLTARSAERDRIPGGYFTVARKAGAGA